MLSYLIAIGIMTSIYGMLALGLNLHYGYTGMINFGHVAFFAVGAYTSALLGLAGYPMALGAIAGALLSAVMAYPLGLLCLRLRADYLAIVTLSFSEIVRVVIISEEWLTNGTRGLAGIPRPFAGLGAGLADIAYLGLVVGALLTSVLVIRKLTGSPFGRLIRAVRDDEDAVRSVGKDPASLKVKVLMLGGGLAGLAGAFYAHYVTYISPDQFLPIITFYVWIAMIMGGAGTLSGAIVGSAILLLFLEGSRFLRDIVPIVTEVQMASLRLAAIGLALVLFMLYRPQGLIPRSQPHMTLALANIRKQLGGLQIIDDMSFSVPLGSLCGIIGPNGAGKSTLFALISGFQASDSGEIAFAGSPLDGLSAEVRARLGLARTFQVPRPFVHLTVRENLAVGAQDQAGEGLVSAFFRGGLVRSQERQIFERVDAVIDFLKLGAVAGQPAGRLSGGQRKLLELGRALMMEPKFILLDEPFAGVNPVLIDEISEKIAQANARGIGFLIVEHNLSSLARLVDRMLVMDRGRLIADGTPDDVLDDPMVQEAYMGGVVA